MTRRIRDSGSSEAKSTSRVAPPRQTWLLVLSTLVLWGLIAFLLVFFRLHEDSSRLFIGLYGSRFHKWVAYDSTLYLDMIQQSKDGAWLFLNRFSPEHASPMYLNSIWLLIGKLAYLFGASPLTAFTVFRFLVVPLFLLALRRFLVEALPHPRLRSPAFFLILFCGGVGWVFGILGRVRPELRPLFVEGRSPETNCFLCLLVSPHIALSMALMLWSFCGLIRVGRRWWITPMIVAALSTFHPYDTAAWYILGSGYILALWLRDKTIDYARLRVYVTSAAVSAPILLYHRMALTTAPDLQGLLRQNALPPESSLRYALALLPVAIPAAHQLVIRMSSFRKATDGEAFTALWALALLPMVYSYPEVPFAWKLGTAMQVPLYTLAAEWICCRLSTSELRAVVADHRVSPGIRAAVTAGVILGICSSIAIVASMLTAAVGHADPYYVEASNVRALRWLAGQHDADGVVMSCRSCGMFAPALADKTAFMGHAIQSVNYPAKKAFARSLFRNGIMSDGGLRKLRRYRVRWILCGRAEREWWGTVRPSRHLQLAYDRNGVQVYRVIY